MVELTALKAALNIPTGTTTHDGYLLALEEAAVEYVQRATGRFLGATDDAAEFVLEGTGDAVLWLPERASAVTAVVSRSYLGGEETAIATDDDDGWALRIPAGETHGSRLIRKGGHVWSRFTEYVVTATIGYDAGAEPAEDRGDVTALVSHWFENRLPAVTGTVAQNVPLHVAERLASRRKLRV